MSAGADHSGSQQPGQGQFARLPARRGNTGCQGVARGGEARQGLDEGHQFGRLEEHQPLVAVMVLTAIVIVAFCRTVGRWLIVLASTAIIATLGFGLIMIWQTTHHTAG